MKFDGSGILFLILLLLEITAGKGKVPVANTESPCVSPFVMRTVFLRSCSGLYLFRVTLV